MRDLNPLKWPVRLPALNPKTTAQPPSETRFVNSKNNYPNIPEAIYLGALVFSATGYGLFWII